MNNQTIRHNFGMIKHYSNETLYISNKQTKALNVANNWFRKTVAWVLDAFSGWERGKEAKAVILETLKTVSLDRAEKDQRKEIGAKILNSKLGKDKEINDIVVTKFFFS